MTGDEEWWDVLDAEGVRTGQEFRRGGEGWPSGCFHLVVAVCVQRKDGSVLLTQRAAGKEFPFGWEFPSGSALAGESSPTAASRELREETGVVVEPPELTLVGRFIETSAFVDFYVAYMPFRSEITLQQSEVMAAQWVTPEEVMERLHAGSMADPWVARLEWLWPSIKRTLC